MIPHRFRKQKPGRPIRASAINQTLDDVRRLAISQPGPGWGGFGSPGCLTSYYGSTDDMLGIACGQDGDTSTGISARGLSSTSQTLGSGYVSLLIPYENGNAEGQYSPVSASIIRVYSALAVEIPGGTIVQCRRNQGTWLVLPNGTDIYQAKTPASGSWAATGAFPYEPASFRANVYALDGSQSTLVAEDAKIWNYVPTSPGNNKVVYVKANPDGSFTMINRLC